MKTDPEMQNKVKRQLLKLPFLSCPKLNFEFNSNATVTDYAYLICLFVGVCLIFM